MPLSWNAILLGTGPDIDTNEASLATEFTFTGASVGSVANPISDRIYNFTVNDADGDNIWDRDNTPASAETATISPRVGGTPEAVFLDNVVVYNATITYIDGTTASISAVTIQLPDGRVFLVPEFTDNADNAALNAQELRSISLDSLINNNTNLTANRQEGNFVPCYVAGTLIRTPGGERSIEDLRPGCLVDTLDEGPLPVRWIGHTTVSAQGDLAPIEIRAGTLGTKRDLKVSPQHRMLIRGWQAELFYGEDEVLVPAKALVNDMTIRRVPGGQVQYVHLMLDRHAVVYANGALSETFRPDDYSIRAMAPETKRELLELFPSLAAHTPAAARPLLRPFEAQKLALI